ncbi:hypothetical protein LX64_04004 [Chitinophaga skermanii]|uniref:Uncharacterized protein n=2 Tax=Chitinophaga skermanii TaxID=331697 RepID=A0A327Q9D3_9BACT|nr:hypothetical protein LX64_04004 [Chitinophaga skermanii]
MSAKPGEPSIFDKMVDNAQWLCVYDDIAWQMGNLAGSLSNTEAEKIGREWFVYKDVDSLWHAAFGRFKEGKYNLAQHYVQDEDGNIDVVCASPDSAMLVSFSKSINAAYDHAGKQLGKSYIRFNKFLRRNADSTISVWLLPAIQPGDLAVYGAEFFYQFDAHGNELVKSNEYYKGSCKGFKIGKMRDVHLDYIDLPDVTFGSIFFAWRHRNQFSAIYINTSKGSTSLTFNQQKGYYWVNGPVKLPPPTF